MIKNKGAFVTGVVLTVTFFIILTIMFSPLFGGRNAMEAADQLFNSISKGSTEYIGGLMKKADSYKGKMVTANLTFKDDKAAEIASKLLSTAGAKPSQQASKVTVSGDLGQILDASLTDSEAMFNNKEELVKQKYGIPGRQALFVWWYLLKEMDKDLTRQKLFKEAAFVGEAVKKGVEPGYNFFGVEAQSARSKVGILSFSLVFYIIYTLWWGVAVLLLCEGFGLQMKAGVKKEV
jgi:hypothetical protein